MKNEKIQRTIILSVLFISCMIAGIFFFYQSIYGQEIGNASITIQNVPSITKEETVGITKVKSKKAFYELLNKAAEEGRKKVTIVYTKDCKQVIGEGTTEAAISLKQQICEYNDKKENNFGYLYANMKQISINVKKTIKSGKNSIIEIRFSYWQNKKQTNILESKIAMLLYQMGITSTNTLTDFEKVKKIHDYILSTVSFQPTSLSNSAYQTLELGEANSKGIALLTYQMFTRANISCQYISSIDGTGWNIVCLDGLWYYLDCAYNAKCEEENGDEYSAFLVGAYDFLGNHIAHNAYETVILQNYKISALKYKWSNIPDSDLSEEENSNNGNNNIIPTPPEDTTENKPIIDNSNSQDSDKENNNQNQTDPNIQLPESFISGLSETEKALLTAIMAGLQTPDYGNYKQEVLYNLPEDIVTEIKGYITQWVKEGIGLEKLDEVTISIEGVLYYYGYEGE